MKRKNDNYGGGKLGNMDKSTYKVKVDGNAVFMGMGPTNMWSTKPDKVIEPIDSDWDDSLATSQSMSALSTH